MSLLEEEEEAREGGGRTGGAFQWEREKVEQIRNSVFRWDIWNGNTQPPPRAICARVQGKNLSICSLLSPGIDSETSTHRCSCTRLARSGRTQDERETWGRDEPSHPQSLCVWRVCQLGRPGTHALRHEQRGGCMGGRATGGW